MKKIMMIVASILAGLSAALAQSSQVKELTSDGPVIYYYVTDEWIGPLDTVTMFCPTDIALCAAVNEMYVGAENMDSIVWKVTDSQHANTIASREVVFWWRYEETTTIRMDLWMYGVHYSDNKTIHIQPPAPPLDAYAELVQDTVNGVAGYYTTLTWDNSQPRVYDALWLMRNGVSVGSVGYIEGSFMDPVPIDPLEPPVYEVEVQDACNYPSFSQIFEVMYLSQHEDIVSDGYWLVLDVGLVNRKDDTRTIHILNENDEDLIQVPLVAAHDSIFVTSDWMSQFSSIRAGLSIESEDKDGTIVSYSNWVDSPSYDGLLENVSAVVVYPNPTTGIVNVQQVEGLENITVFDCLGRTVQTIPNFGDSASVQLNLLPFGKGVYYLRIQTAAAVEVRKIVVR